ncbi:MAG: hypothetical protein ABJF23_09150 [Bryobacteraceae bacterium]
MIRLLAVTLLGAALGFGASTASWEMSNYQDFSRGRFQGVSLTRDGRILLAPGLETVFTSDQPSIWSVAQTPDGTLYLGTGHRGRVYRVDGPGRSTLLWTAPQPEIFAVAVGPDGAVYAGTSPDGKVYRIQGGKATEYFSPGARYIWALAFGKDGALYVGTGDQGKVFRVASAGVGELYYETGQANVTCLALDSEGRLLAGSEPNGIVYRITAKDKAFVLYDAGLPEIRAIAVDPAGAVYVAALGGSLSQRTSAAGAAVTSGTGVTQVTGQSTSITVTDEAAETGVDLKTKAEATKPQQAAQPVVAAPLVEIAGVEKSALYKINSDNTVETIWTSKEENAYDLLLSGDQIFFSTDGQGRIYRLSPDGRATLLVQTNEGEVTRLLSSGGSIIAATGTMGKILRLSTGAGPSGYFESQVHDASTVARWGQISWRAQKDAQSKLVFRTRAGNSARPDRTWSDWSEPLSSPNGSTISSPNARFVQWKAEFAGSGGSSPVLTGVNLSYLPQNTPPVVKTLNVTTQVGASASGSKAAAPAASTATYSITVTDTGESGPSSLSGTPTQTISRGLTQQIQISWQAEDADGDRLLYTLYFRGEDERQWKMLRSNFADTSMLLDGEVFADGKYLFRVVASDKMSNAAGTAREAELISAPILFDNTPPSVKAGPPRRNGSTVEVDLEARDAVSALRRAEYSLDAGAWVPLDPADGVLDGLQEQFRLKVDNLTAGEHLLVIRVFDSASNVGLTKVVVQ